jgi:hypothetical protein
LKFFDTHAGFADWSTFSRFIAPVGGYCKASIRRLPPVLRISAGAGIVLPSRTAASLQPTMPASRFAGRTIARVLPMSRCGYHMIVIEAFARLVRRPSNQNKLSKRNE